MFNGIDSQVKKKNQSGNQVHKYDRAKKNYSRAHDFFYRSQNVGDFEISNLIRDTIVYVKYD